MKQMFAMAVVTIMAGGVVCAQQPAAAAPAVSVPTVSGKAIVTTNVLATAKPVMPAAGARLDLSKIQQVIAELKAVDSELKPLAEKIKISDPEIKLLLDRREALKKELSEVEQACMAKIDAKLNVDPHTAALVSKRNELIQQQQTLVQQMRASYPAGMPAMGGMRPGAPGAGPRMMPGAAPVVPAPAATPVVAPAVAPAAAPAADKAAEPAAK